MTTGILKFVSSCLVICDPCCCSIVTYLVARLGEALVLAQSYLANPLHLQEISYIKKKFPITVCDVYTNTQQTTLLCSVLPAGPNSVTILHDRYKE